MKIFHNNRHIKTIPEKFSGIGNITDYLDDEFSKRLTITERKALRQHLLREHVDAFLKEKTEKPELKQLIHQTHPVKILRIIKRDGKRYFAVRMSNGVELKCEPWLWNMSPVKETVKRLY